MRAIAEIVFAADNPQGLERIMWRQRIKTFLRLARRTWWRRAWCFLFLFVLVNVLWSIVGDWEICFGRKYFECNDHGNRRSGIRSCRGFLVLAVRESWYVGSGISQRQKEYREWYDPWSIQASMHVGPDMYRRRWYAPILEDRPQIEWPGLVFNWQDASLEYHNRGVAIHWGWLLLLSTLPVIPVVCDYVRDGRRVAGGLCLECGYDLRATPDRCPECGRTPAVGRLQ